MSVLIWFGLDVLIISHLFSQDFEMEDGEGDEEAEERAFKAYLGWKEVKEDTSFLEEPKNDGSESPVPDWLRCSPADLFFAKDPEVSLC